MAIYSSRLFGEKIDRLERKHRKLARGSVTVMRADGLMVMRPRRNGLRRLVVFAFILGMALVAFKSVVFVADGAIDYETRLARLSEGTGPERVAAQIMEIDGVTGLVILHGKPYIQQGLKTLKDVRFSLVAADWW